MTRAPVAALDWSALVQCVEAFRAWQPGAR